MKKIIAILLLVVFLMALTACGEAIERGTMLQLDKRLELMYCSTTKGDGNNLYYYRDITTDVVYVEVYRGMAVMMKADGTPYLWSELVEEGVTNNVED